MKLKGEDYPRVRRTGQKAISLDTFILLEIINIEIIYFIVELMSDYPRSLPKDALSL